MAKKTLDPLAGLFGDEKQKPETSNQIAHEVQQVHDLQEIDIIPIRLDTLHNTRGRKGHKLPRINMAFEPENHEFIKLTSRQQGISATEYVNNLIDEARKKTSRK